MSPERAHYGTNIGKHFFFLDKSFWPNGYGARMLLQKILFSRFDFLDIAAFFFE